MSYQENPSRRTVLSLAGVVLGTAALTAAGAPAAVAATDAVTLEPVADDLVPVLAAGSGRGVDYPRQLAVRVRSAAGSLAAGTRVEMTYDGRVYEAGDRVWATLDGRVVDGVTAGAPRLDESGATRRTVVLDRALTPGKGGLVIGFGSLRPVLYPRDLVPGPRGVVAETHGRRHTLTGKGREPAGLPWGVELSAFWDRRTWGPEGRFVYYYPAQVTLRAVGPGRSPRALAFVVDLDPQVVTDLRPAWLRLNDQEGSGTASLVGAVRAGALYRTTWRTPARLRAGDVLEIGFTGVTRAPAGALPGIKHPVVALDATTPDPRMRVTGRTSVSRQDAVWA